MAKKKKKKSKGFDLEEYTKYELGKMKKGETHIDKSGKWRTKKYRIPKWLSKYKWNEKSTHINFRKKYGRWMNNEERILTSMFSFSEYKLKQLSNYSKIDYRNVSRYLQSMEKKGLITIKNDYDFKRQKSGTLKVYHNKKVSLTKEGRELKKEVLGYWV